MPVMKCAACGYSCSTRRFPSLDIPVQTAEPITQMVALEIDKIDEQSVIRLYLCPNCGTLRVRLK